MYLKQRLWMFWNTIDKDNKNERDKIELEIDKIVFDGDVYNIIIIFVSYLVDGGWNIIKYKKNQYYPQYVLLLNSHIYKIIITYFFLLVYIKYWN